MAPSNNSSPNPQQNSNLKPSESTNATSSSSRKSLPEMAKEKLESGNASQLGDPISLKAETADSHPTEKDRGAKDVKPERKADTMNENEKAARERGGGNQTKGEGKGKDGGVGMEEGKVEGAEAAAVKGNEGGTEKKEKSKL